MPNSCTRHWLPAATVIVAGSSLAGAVSSEPRLLECESNFPQHLTANSLSQKFGPENLLEGEIYIGEGVFETGIILFADSPEDRVEILWSNVNEKRNPRSVKIRGVRSNWKTPLGLSLGTDLRTIERLNAKPFELAGFGWDYSGTVISWSGGSLQTEPSPDCSVRVRMNPEAVDGTNERAALYRQVLGDRSFKSSHPAMQELNPIVYDIWLEY